MARAGQRGFALIEAVASAGILAITAGATLAAFAAVARLSASDPGREAAERELRRVITIVGDVAKYRDPNAITIGPDAWQTSVPSALGSPVPLTVTAVRLSQPPPAIMVSVRYPAGATTAVLSKTITLAQEAPAPGTELFAPGFYPDPNGP